jgi:hypothetical protein
VPLPRSRPPGKSLGKTTVVPPPTSGDDTEDYFDRQVNSLNKHAAALQADTLAIGRNEAQTETYKAELSLLQAIERDGGEVTNEQIEAYTKKRASMSADQALVQAGITLNTEHAQSFDEVTQRIAATSAALMKSKNDYQGVQDALKTFGDDAVDVFDNLLNHSKSFSSELRSVMQSLEKQLLEAGLTGSGPFAKSFGFASSSPGGVGGLFGLLGSAFSGFHADGGDIPSGSWGIAGERGPEIITGPSTVIPAGRFGGGAVSHSINVAVSVSGARGSKEIEDAVHAGTQRAMAFSSAIIKGYDRSLPTRLNDMQQRFG